MPIRAVWIQENTNRCHATIAFARLIISANRVASPFFKGEGEGEGGSQPRRTLHGKGDPSPSSSPLQQGERRPRPPGRRRACPTTRLDCVLVASAKYRYVAPPQSRSTKKISCFSCFPDPFVCPLLHSHKCADWNFREEFARSICRQPDAAVRRRIVRHNTSMHSKIETAQAHEIRHLNMVNRGTMVAFLVGDHKLAPLSRVARPTGRAPRLINWFAVPDQSDPLHCQRNFDPQFIRRRPAAEKDLRRPPVAGLRGDI